MRATLLPCLTAVPLLMTTPALADMPRVAVDIAPVHALVAQVMAGVGTPDLVLPPGVSPHGYAMRPSDAGALQEADLVIWVGPELTPWMEGPLDTLAGDAARLGLLALDGVRRLDFREGASFEAHEHGDEDDHGHEEEHDHDHDAEAEATGAHDHDHDHEAEAEMAEAHDHDHEQGHEVEAAEGEGDHGHDMAEDDHDHAHDGTDPHAWLDPMNAAIWLDAIAAELSRLDPVNAETYAANAAEARATLATQQAGIATRMDALSGGFIVFHDAYHYFEARFGIEAAGAISLSDASEPGPARVAEIRDLVAAEGISCVFVEPQFNRGMVDAVFEGTGVRISEIDPLGATLDPGPALYGALIEGMAQSFESCLADS
jgi:zinc transport system substrate-binding protein